ncbi:hypothetical protein BKA61DRAFT_654164 [Leptodontidium sp. MPI-SDFR-AT-0119]|nr:hypothetical protein BKA61DRAFT_654164 [Leptodontidium sp. MPI-SDFR-AT-0119]
MSNIESAPPSGFSAWASASGNAPATPSTPDQSTHNFPAPPPGFAMMDDSMPQGRAQKAKQWRILDLAAITPNSFGPFQQMPSRHGPDTGYAHQAHNSNGHIGTQWQLRSTSARRSSSYGSGLGTSHRYERSVQRNEQPGRWRSQNFARPNRICTIFGKLSPELRIMIWAEALKTDRILEVIWDGADEDPAPLFHYHHPLSPRSCLRPTLMNVCHESRAEAERFYTLVDFTTTIHDAAPYVEKCGPIKTYFNPDWDVILFGRQSCMWTVVCFIQDQRQANIDIRRIAIISSGRLLRCHNWNPHDRIHGPGQIKIDNGYAIVGNCTIMQALHGIHKDVASTEMASGVKGLKEVNFVVPTHLIPGIAGKVDEFIAFRPARGNGLTIGQVKIKNSLQRQVRSIEAGGVFQNCSIDDSMNNWAGENKLDFKFVAFAPKSPIQGMIFDSMIITTNEIPKLSENDWQFIKNVEQWTGCHVKIQRNDYSAQPVREVDLYSTKSGVSEAFKHIRTRLNRLPGSIRKYPSA